MVRLPQTLFLSNPPVNLTEVNKSLGLAASDKSNPAHTFGGRHYLDIYEPLFSKWRDDEFDLVEIGVRGGCSMRLWSAYFTKARIHGVDIDPVCINAGTIPRVKITIGSQDDPTVLARIVQACSELRIVIDDGSHMLVHLLATFNGLWPKVVSHGLYIMEDVSTTYWGGNGGWPGSEYNKPTPEILPRARLDELILSRIKDMDYHRGDVLSLAVSNNLLIFEKL